MPKYSLVVPAYNEEKSLPLFYEAVVPMMESLQEEFEMIFVNDGSRDATKEILKELAAKDSRVKVCSFSRNFGQQAALLCGFAEAKGDAVIAMDADLQDPPPLTRANFRERSEFRGETPQSKGGCEYHEKSHRSK